MERHHRYLDRYCQRQKAREMVVDACVQHRYKDGHRRVRQSILKTRRGPRRSRQSSEKRQLHTNPHVRNASGDDKLFYLVYDLSNLESLLQRDSFSEVYTT